MVGAVQVVPPTEPGQVVEGGEAALGEVGDPVVVLEPQAGVTGRHHTPRVPEEEGRPDPLGHVASGRVDGGDVGALGDEHLDEGLAQQLPGVVDAHRAHPGDLAALPLAHRAPAQGL